MLASSSTTRDLPISAEEVTKVSAGAMKSFTPSTVTSNSSLKQPKIEVNLFLEDNLNLGPFHQLETQLLDSMEISEQQPSHSHKHEAFPYGFPPQRYPVVASNSSRVTSTNGLSTDKDCATSSFERASLFLPHCSPQGLKNINLDVDSDSDDEGNPAKLKKVAYSYAENHVLAQCWIDVSIDSAVSNAQKMDQMWMRISRVYVKNRPPNTPSRHWTSLKSHFYSLQKQTRWFSICFNRNAKLWGNNKSDADIIDLAQQDYKDRHSGQGFKHIGVWKLLSVCPKFALVDGDVRVTKKTKTSEGGAYTSSFNPNSSANDDIDAEHIHPIGQKAVEMNAKGKGKPEGVGEIKKRIDKKMVGFEQYLEQKVAAISRIAQAKEYKILMKNTSNMTSNQLKIHHFMCDKIKKYWGM